MVFIRSRGLLTTKQTFSILFSVLPLSRNAISSAATVDLDVAELAVLNGVTLAKNLGYGEPAPQTEWRIDVLAGRFLEVTGAADTAVLTSTVTLVLQAQQRGELAAWVTGPRAAFFPPDFAASGVDLEALPVVRVDDITNAARVADRLVRSGAFAVVVLDLGAKAPLPIPTQTRLVGLAKKNRTTLVSITRKSHSELGGSLVSLRGETNKRRTAPDSFVCELHAVKDKCNAPGWVHRESCRGTEGLV